MNAVLVKTGRGTSVVLGLLLATASYGQAPTPAPLPPRPAPPAPRPILVEKPEKEQKAEAIKRLEILNGSGGITVRYFGNKDMAPTELAALFDLERAENEANFAENMNALRNQYVRDEIQMENRRHQVQMVLYGVTTQTTFGSNLGGGLLGPMSLGAVGIPNNLALVANPFYGAPGLFPGQYAFSPLYPNVYTPGYWGDTGFGASVTTVAGLQNGMGDEGVMKTAIAKAMAGGYPPETMVSRRTAYYPRIREAKGLQEPGNIKLLALGETTLVLKDGKELKGRLVWEDADWYVIQSGGQEISIRNSEVNRVTREIPK
jgi:hypothetical protein